DRPEDYKETAENNPRAIFLDELDADDLPQGGPALVSAGDVGGGVVLDRAASYGSRGDEGDDDGDGVKDGDEDDGGDGVPHRPDADGDGDGILDGAESTASVTSYGGAPAVVIGSETQSISLGAAGTGDEAYGFINRGNVTAQGVYDEVAANAIVIGGNAGQT